MQDKIIEDLERDWEESRRKKDQGNDNSRKLNPTRFSLTRFVLKTDRKTFSSEIRTMKIDRAKKAKRKKENTRLIPTPKLMLKWNGTVRLSLRYNRQWFVLTQEWNNKVSLGRGYYLIREVPSSNTVMRISVRHHLVARRE